MIRLNYLVAIPVVCILLESIHIINLVVILINPEYIWVFNVLYSGFEFDAVPPIDILFQLNIAVSITIQLLFIFWYSIEASYENYTRNIGYLWIILGGLFLTNILLFAVISEWYILPIKNSPTFDNYLVVVSCLITQLTIIISSLCIGIVMAIPER